MVQRKIVLKRLIKYALLLINFCIIVPLSAEPLDLAFNFLNKADEAYRLGDVDNAYKYINQAFVISNENDKNSYIYDSILYFAQTVYSEKLNILLNEYDEDEFEKIKANLEKYPQINNLSIKKLIEQIKLKQNNPESGGQLKDYQESILNYSEIIENVADSQNDFEINNETGYEEISEKYKRQGKIKKTSASTIFFSVVSLIIIISLTIILIIIVCVKGATHQHLQEKQYVKIFKGNSTGKSKTISSVDIMKSIADIQNSNNEITKEESEELQKMAVKCQELGNRIDSVTGRKNNSKSVSEIVYKLSLELGVTPVISFVNFCAAMIYDAGFLEIDPDLLNSVSFNEEEKEAMKTHVSLTRKYLKFVPKKYYSIFEDAATKHHENMDGSGYPRGLAGGEIPQLARIIRVAESFVSMTSRRLYRAPLDKEGAVKKLKEQPQFYDPDVVSVLEKIV